MHLAGVSLQHFRSYTQQTFLFPKKTTIILGNNAAGKTSVIEAIAMLSTGESFRAQKVEEMIQFSAEIGRIKGKIEPETELEVTLTRGLVNQKRVQTRLYAVNTVRRLKKNFLGNILTVVFRPEDLRLIEGSPSRRREFIDTILCVTDRDYLVSLKTYDEALKRRNRLLQQIRNGEMEKSVLAYWNSLVLKHGEIVQEKRRGFFAFFAEVEFPVPFSIEYQPSVMSTERLAQYAEKEVAAGHTLIGPHKDDFVVLREENGQKLPVSAYGSRGQQRLAVLWLKMSELEYVKSQMNVQPILLLDDILSELDLEHRRDVISLLHLGQSIITTTEEKMVEEICAALVETDYDVITLPAKF